LSIDALHRLVHRIEALLKKKLNIVVDNDDRNAVWMYFTHV
jgi:hypothetical protein